MRVVTVRSAGFKFNVSRRSPLLADSAISRDAYS